MRVITCGLAWSVAALLVAAAPAPRRATVVPPPGAWITGVDGLREVRVLFDGPVDVPRDAVIVRSAGRGLITNFRTRYDDNANVLTIEFVPALRAERVTIVLDDVIARAVDLAVLRYRILVGDATRDGVVDTRDIDRVLVSTGTCRQDAGFDPRADLDRDRCIGPAYLAVVVANLGRTMPAPSGAGPRGPRPAGGLPPEILAALPQRYAADGPTTSSLRLLAIYDQGQTGSLPPVSVVRDYATIDALGAAVGPNQPRWGRPQGRAPLREWTLARSTTQSITWVASGNDSDGVTPMLCYFQPGPERIDFWIDAAIDDGDPTFFVDVERELIRDLLFGTPLERAFHAYQPEAAIALPGCFLFMCQRWYDYNENPAFRSWRVEGISVVALQRDDAGDFVFEIVGDGPRLNNDATALGMERGAPWAMTAYYPVVEGQDPLLRAFIPVVDYISFNSIKRGGQVFLVEATRPDTRTAWSFGEFYLIDEHVEEGTHFHTAAWTPRGVVVAMGDGEALNENVLHTCTDWNDYANPFNWTKHDRVYGAGTHPDLPAGTTANQFGGAVPGRDPNRFLVGADVNAGGVYECTVPEDPDEGLVFTRLWGEHWTDGESFGHVALWFHKPAPERSTRSVTRVSPNVLPTDIGLDAARVIYSDDDVHFTTVARLPTTLHRQSYVALHGDDILLFNRAGGVNPSPKGIWSIPAPVGLGPSRGLAVAPGGVNLLAVSGGALVGVSAGAGTVLTPITDGLHPETGAPLDVPGHGPVYRIQADGSNGVYLSFRPTATPVAPGFAYLSLWVRVIGPEGVKARVLLTDTGGQAELANWSQHRITNREQWVPYTVLFDTTVFAGDYMAQLRLIADPARAADFLVLVDGFYADEPPPYSTAPGTTSPPEQVTQPLGAIGPTWTVGIEFNVPYASEDWLGHPAAAQDGGRLYLATLLANEADYAELYADLDARTVGVDVFRDGVPIGSASVGDVAIQRGDRLWVALAQSSSTAMVLYAWSGGSREDGLTGATCFAGFTTSPEEVRLGRADFSRVPMIDVLMIAVQTNRSLSASGVIDLLSGD